MKDKLFEDLQVAVDKFEHHFTNRMNELNKYENELKRRIRQYDNLDIEELLRRIRSSEVKYYDENAGILLLEMDSDTWDSISQTSELLSPYNPSLSLHNVYLDAEDPRLPCEICGSEHPPVEMRILCDDCCTE